ncbi:MAG: hypothetical protein ACYDBJ_14095 [Aggregatilineales bacterium]
MKYVIGFLKFWYDFFIGDAWEIAVGVVITLVLVALLAAGTLQSITWLVLPICVILTLGISVLWYARKHTATH